MEEYTNRELGIVLKNLTKKIDDGFAGVHTRQDLTNGRIQSAENNINKLNGWRKYITGGLTILTVVMLPLIFLVISKIIQ